MRALFVAATLIAGIFCIAPAQAQMYGNNPYDPGCNVNVGGNCGRQLDAWNNTWRRMHLPLEPGQGAHGYYPGGYAGVIPNGIRPGYGVGSVVGGNAGRAGAQTMTTTHTIHRVIIIRVQHNGVAATVPAISNSPNMPIAASPRPSSGPAVVNNVGYQPPGINVVRQ